MFTYQNINTSEDVQLFPKCKASFNFVTGVTAHNDFGAHENKVCHCFHFSPSMCHEVMELGAMILEF